MWGGGSRQIICVYKGREREREREGEGKREKEREREIRKNGCLCDIE